MTKKILVTGATGYVGGRLVPLLIEAGHDVRIFARDSKRLRDYSWANAVEIIEGDARDQGAVNKATKDIDVVYYLLHSVYEGKDLARFEDEIANNFAKSTLGNDVKRIIYLGGIINESKSELSTHLSSRLNTGEILRNSGVPTIEFRAAVIIGSGSASFEMLRYLTERLPFMITPKWLNSRIQPIAIRDVLRYLVKAATVKETINDHFDIGGPDVLTYESMMQKYAAVAGLRKRIIVTVPILTPQLSSHWVNLVTPVPRRVARPLINSLTSEVVAADERVKDVISDPKEGLLSFDIAVKYALDKVINANVDTRWSTSLSSTERSDAKPSDPLPTDPDWTGGTLYIDERKQKYTGSVDILWQVIESIGGKNKWYSFPLAWEVRGLLDRIVGGVGIRRGRRDAKYLRVGETVDFWRVDEIVQGEMLLLVAEMKLPGKASLLLSIEEGQSKDEKEFHLVATFRPKGLAGHLYWWIIRPFHGIIFGSMVKRIPAKALELSAEAIN